MVRQTASSTELLMGWCGYELGGAVLRSKPGALKNGGRNEAEQETWCWLVVGAELTKVGNRNLPSYIKARHWLGQALGGESARAMDEFEARLDSLNLQYPKYFEVA